MSQTPATRHTIKLLPEHLIDQIKAGEVVERPASLVKELLENSIDAGATKIDIHIIENGMDLIRIDDNGNGISFDELPFAFGRHATSKIERFDDLFNLHSFGFRGEALASISSVSRLTCTSTPIEKDLQGGKITIHGGKVISHSEFKNYQYGTSIYIKDLFFNTPVRLKFLKSQTSEKNALTKIIHAFIISNGKIEFSLRFDEKEKVIFPKTSAENMNSRIKKLFFKKKDSDDDLIEFENEYDNYKIKGYISKKSTTGYSGKKQFLFANNRFFHEKSLHQSVMRQAERVWGHGKSGHYVILYEVPPAKIDVNIHPNKTQIKFQESSLVYSLTNTSVKQALSELKVTDFATSNSIDADFSNIAYGSINSNTNFHYSKPDSLTNEQNTSYSAITNRYFLQRKHEESSLIFDLGALFINYWIENINSSPLLENVLSPLLIAEPFNIAVKSNDHYFNFFKDLGFEFERIDERIIVLRTIPNYLNGTPYLEVLQNLLSQDLNRTSEEWFIKQLSRHLKDDESFSFKFRDAQINELINYFDYQTLLDKNIIKNIDNLFLSKIMKL